MQKHGKSIDYIMMNNRRIIYISGLMYVARERGVVVGGVSDRQLRKNVVVVVWGE